MLESITLNNNFLNRVLFRTYTSIWMINDRFKECRTGKYKLNGNNRTELLRKITKYIKDGDIVYDIGASIGIYSIRIASKFKGCKIYSFEPSPDNYKRLVQNIKLFKLNLNVIVSQLAISNNNKDKRLYISNDIFRTSLNKHDAEYKSKIINTINVNCVTLDYLIGNNVCKAPNVIKIDAEGEEYKILTGAREVLRTYKPKLFIEPHSIEERRLITEYLKEFGYTVTNINYPMYCYCV